MKQTIELQGNRKAVVQIPYSKFTATSNSFQKASQGTNCCDGKVIVFGCGGSSKSKLNSYEINSILADLQASYDKDVKQLQQKIEGLQDQRQKMKQAHIEENLKIKNEFNKQLQEKTSAVELLRVECKRKDGQIADLLNEKEMLMRSKISQFRQREYIDKIHQLQSIIKLKDLELNELAFKMQTNNQERIKVQQKRIVDQGNWERESRDLKLKLEEISHRIRRETEERQSLLVKKNEEWTKRIREYQLMLEDANQKNRETAGQMSNLRSDLSSQIQMLTQIKSNLEASLQSEKGKVQQLEADSISACENLKELRAQNLLYLEKLQKNEEAILILDQQKGDLLLELQNRIGQIAELKQEISNKEKVYEVKIQRVVDGKPQIEQLRNVVAELEMQLKELSAEKDVLAEELKKREYAIGEFKGIIAKLESEIAGFKAYIQKREGSFKWAVEREIQKDIAVSESKNQCYKVSQVREYSRDTSGSRNYKMAFDRISAGIQQHLNGTFPEQIILTDQNQPYPGSIEHSQATYGQPNENPLTQLR